MTMLHEIDEREGGEERATKRCRRVKEERRSAEGGRWVWKQQRGEGKLQISVVGTSTPLQSSLSLTKADVESRTGLVDAA